LSENTAPTKWLLLRLFRPAAHDRLSLSILFCVFSGHGEVGDSAGYRRASFVSLTLEGLRHLLNLRALISLHLPWIEPDEVEALRDLAEQTGRTSLFIERIVPLGRRSLLQRHWINTGSIDTDDSRRTGQFVSRELSCMRRG
jgi:hypothetical protein